MSDLNNIIRAWKDREYLESLTPEERELVPENPAGIIELSDQEMELVGGGLFRSSCICIDIDITIIKITNDSAICNITNDSATCFNLD